MHMIRPICSHRAVCDSTGPSLIPEIAHLTDSRQKRVGVVVYLIEFFGSFELYFMSQKPRTFGNGEARCQEWGRIDY